MLVISARNPVFTDDGVELLVTFTGLGEVPFHARPTDPEALGRDLYIRAIAGEFGPVAPIPEQALPDFADLVAEKMEAINAGKNVALDAGFQSGATFYDSDAKARLAYLELALKLGQTPAYETDWKASRGVWVTMNAALFAAVQPAYEAHIQACFAWQAAREMEVAAAVVLATTDESAARAALAEIDETM